MKVGILCLIGALLGLMMFLILRAIISNLRNNRKNTALIKTVTELHRGTWSEQRLILTLLQHKIPASTIFHDLYVEIDSNNYSQIDIVVATKIGIIVFEVKDYSGWIFGKGDQMYWTQILAYGKDKYRFYNPVMQNKRHVDILKKKLKPYADVPFYSVIVFYGNCVLKDVSSIPEGVLLVNPTTVLHCIDSILQNNPPANYTSKIGVVDTLKRAVNNGNNSEIRIQHISNIHHITRNN